MTSICRTSLGVVVASLVAASAASAQLEPPPAEGAPPIEAGAPPTQGEAPAPPRSRGIVASQLEAVDPFVVGTLTPAEGALPPTLWAGSDLAAFTEAASRTAGESGYLAANQMAARALLSGGPSPPRPGDLQTAAHARLEALLDLGRVEAVDRIVTQVPGGLNEPDLAALAVQARLALNQIAPACRVGADLTNGRDGAFWLRLRTACYAWAGETAAAQVTLDLAVEADDQVADEDFMTWIFAAAERDLPRNPPTPRDALESALAQSAGYAFDAETLEGQALAVAVGLLRDADVSAETRAIAALRAARSGAIAPAELAAALDSLPAPAGASPTELTASARDAEFPLAEALLRRVATGETATPIEVAEAIDAALSRAQSPADFILTARTFADALTALPPSAELVAYAPRFALAAAAIGDQRLAYAWLDPRAPGLGPAFGGADFTPILNTEPDFSQSPIDAAERLAAEVVVAAGDPRATPRRLASTALARLAAVDPEDEDGQALARRDALLLLALGAEVSPELRRAASAAAGESYSASDIADQALAAARLAAASGALGETALYLAQAAGDAGPAHAPAIAAAIQVARSVGLNDDARALAVESMLAARVGAAD